MTAKLRCVVFMVLFDEDAVKGMEDISHDGKTDVYFFMFQLGDDALKAMKAIIHDDRTKVYRVRVLAW